MMRCGYAASSMQGVIQWHVWSRSSKELEEERPSRFIYMKTQDRNLNQAISQYLKQSNLRFH